MNVIKFLLVVVQALQVLSTIEQLGFEHNCGETPNYSHDTIVGGYKIEPDEYSWLASLRYGDGKEFGICAGSVIHKLFVLTAAHCVEGNVPDQHGGLNGVRLGDFSRQPYCDYGSSNCTTTGFQDFEITEKICHENYKKINNTPTNDIALLRLNQSILFDDKLRPVCLPFFLNEPAADIVLIVTGWGQTMRENYKPEKRAVSVPRLSKEKCAHEDGTRFCAGILHASTYYAKTSCGGDSGGPIMNQFHKKKMAVEGIVSFKDGVGCVSAYDPTHYTRVRNYIEWIINNVHSSIYQ